MKIEIVGRNVELSTQTKQHIKHRASFAFGRTEHLIETVTITLVDVNGPKGGEDKQCKVLVNSHLIPPLLISDTQSTLEKAINKALSRAGRNLQQRLKRSHNGLKKRMTHQDFQPSNALDNQENNSHQATDISQH